MTDGIHPDLVCSLIVWVHLGYPLVNVLETESVLLRRQNCLPNESGVREVRFLRRIGTGWNNIQNLVVIVRRWSRRRDYVDDRGRTPGRSGGGW